MNTISGTWYNIKEDLNSGLNELLKKDSSEKEVIELMIYMINSPRTRTILKKEDNENGR